MASITSIISLFVVLFAYCYSLPVAPQSSSSTPKYEFTTTGKTIVNYDNKMNMELVPDKESTGRIHKSRASDEHMMVDSTTPLNLEHVTRPPRGSEEFIDSTPPMSSTFESSTTETDDEHAPRELDESIYSSSPMTSTDEYPVTGVHGLLGFLPTTIETSTKFHERAIKFDMESEGESTTHAFPEKEVESDMKSVERPSFVKSDSYKKTTQMVAKDESRSESAVDSFGHMTGFLDSKRPEDRPTTPVYDETTTPPRTFVKTQEFRKTVSIIPPKVEEAIVNSGIPSKTIVVKGGVENQRKPLSQDQSQPVVEKRSWN
jgi:hypothetical protein